ncbi:MAG: hypothetical protein ACTSWP_02945 [Candidatus Freyarchaeota archaeon]|nr:hypothetical protein [Candidatus Freyrarchaeum guaymaensis]
MSIPDKVKEFFNSLEIKEDGSLIYDDERLVFTPTVLLSVALMAVPLEKFGGVIQTVYRRGFARYGRALAESREKLGAKGVVEYFLNLLSIMGSGRAELVDFSESRVSFRMYSSLYGEDVGNYLKAKGLEPRPVCPYGYVVEGILNYFAEKEGKPSTFTSEETKCIANGDEFCEFIIKQT